MNEIETGCCNNEPYQIMNTQALGRWGIQVQKVLGECEYLRENNTLSPRGTLMLGSIHWF